jgi:Tol biopolymer transport system component
MRGLAAIGLGTLTLVGASVAATPEERIAFTRQVGGRSDLFTIRPDGSGLERLTRTSAFEFDPRWGPNGRRLVAESDHGLVIYDSDGHVVRRIRIDTPHVEPRWSPDGRWLSYLALGCFDPLGHEEPICADLWLVRSDGSRYRQLSHGDIDTAHGRGTLYAWSPDAKQIVYEAVRGLVIVDVRNARKRFLIQSPTLLIQNPDWSPDGRWIAVTRQLGTVLGSDLYAVAPDGRWLHRLTHRRDILRPVWSHDGERIAYLVYESEVDINMGVFVENADGSGARRLGTTKDDTRPVWSPNSSKLIWTDFEPRLMIASADGRGRPSELTKGESPDWR